MQEHLYSRKEEQRVENEELNKRREEQMGRFIKFREGQKIFSLEIGDLRNEIEECKSEKDQNYPNWTKLTRLPALARYRLEVEDVFSSVRGRSLPASKNK